VSVCGTDSTQHALEVFLGSPASRIAPCGTLRRTLANILRIFRQNTLVRLTLNHASARNFGKRYPIKLRKSGRILTPCPSPTSFDLSLGPTNPPMTTRAEETLNIRRGGFSPPNATHAEILTPDELHGCFRFRFTVVGTLPYHPYGFTVSVWILSPVTFSAQNLSTSELLRTLSRVAASKPTFWLSKKFHCLSHLNPT